MGDPMKRRDCLMLGVTISFLILSPSIFSCVATVPPEDELKTSSFVDPLHVQTPDQEKGTWRADTNFHPGDKPVFNITELLGLLHQNIDESADLLNFLYVLELEEALALNRESVVASALDRLSTEPNLGSEIDTTLDRLRKESNLGSAIASTLDQLNTESNLGSEVAVTLADLLPSHRSPLVRSTRSELEELASDDPPWHSLCESEPDRRESEEAEASRDSDDLGRASDDSTWGGRTESPLSSTTTPHGRETEEVAPAGHEIFWTPCQGPLGDHPLGLPQGPALAPTSTTTPRGMETEEVAPASTPTPSGRESELAVDSTGHSSTPDSSLTPSSIPQSSDLASASTPHSRELELASCHLNEAAPVDDDYPAIHIDTEQVDSFRNPSLIRRSGQDQHLGGADLEYVDSMIHEHFAQNPHPIPPVNLVTTTLVQPPAPSFQAGFNLNPYHPIDIPQQPRITSTGSGDDQLGIAIRSIAHAAVYRNEDLGRAVVMGLVVPLTLGMLTMNTRPSPTVANLVLISTLIGFTTILNGWRFRNDYPRSANRMEQLGEALVLASLFGLLSTYLPPSLAWVPWLCWALTIAPLIPTFFTEQQSRLTFGPE